MFSKSLTDFTTVANISFALSISQALLLSLNLPLLISVILFGIYLLRISIINPLKAELNTICHLLVLLRARHILYISRIRVKKRYNNI